jgi:hypothetical protein
VHQAPDDLQLPLHPARIGLQRATEVVPEADDLGQLLDPVRYAAGIAR